MGFDDLTGKATDALGEHSDKVEEHSDTGLDKAGEFAEGKGLDSEKTDQGREFLDGKIGE
ncbi:hypothetical protein ASG73_09790 [Janibacter sp. Soil728]|uniref:Rv0909 family putative TA system antitoxin n=1 Tax=Janibacter sp. Soil728 TaxID=1736393 RepID=UPI000700C183|nr:Rv0909 family putative TA system antitoxin [Janibacter sp. Soil728]KRE37895.1 hypothetical protein ASG73_09790 [Janibacter sp. Soil728]